MQTRALKSAYFILAIGLALLCIRGIHFIRNSQALDLRYMKIAWRKGAREQGETLPCCQWNENILGELILKLYLKTWKDCD